MNDIILRANYEQFKRISHTPPYDFGGWTTDHRRTRARTGPARLTVTAECRLGARPRDTAHEPSSKRGLIAAAAGKRIGASRPSGSHKSKITIMLILLQGNRRQQLLLLAYTGCVVSPSE